MPEGASTCRWCGLAIKWTKTERGKSMPLDLHPCDEGNVEIVNGIAVVYGGLELLAARESHSVLHISHFATCKSPFNPSNRRKK